MPTVQVSLRKVSALYPESFLGKLYQVFGEEQTDKFLKIFGGLEIKVPAQRDLLNLAREQIIWELCGKKRSKDLAEAIQTASERTGWPKEAVKRTFETMSQVIGEIDLIEGL